MEHKIVDTFVRYIHKKMPSDAVMKPKKSPTEKTNKFKEYFGSHHDLRIFGSHHKRNVPLMCRFYRRWLLLQSLTAVWDKLERINLKLLLFLSTSVLIISNSRVYVGISSLIRLFYALSFCWSFVLPKKGSSPNVVIKVANKCFVALATAVCRLD